MQIFQEIQDDFDETSRHIALFGWASDYVMDYYFLAQNFKRAGDILVSQGLNDMEAYELLYPVLYNYRHAVELYLKALVESKKSHKLLPLLAKLEDLLKEHHNTDMPEWFSGPIKEFAAHDPGSIKFRYPTKREKASLEEKIVDLSELKKIMDVLDQSFHRIWLAEMEYRKANDIEQGNS